jgi:chromosome segregation ATPase
MNGNNLQSYLLFALLGMFVAYMIWGQDKIEVDVKSYENKIKALETTIDSTYTLNFELNSKILELDINLEESRKKIQQLNGSIYRIKKETDEKLNAINDYSNDELYLFFTERYGQYNDSIKETDSKVSN